VRLALALADDPAVMKVRRELFVASATSVARKLNRPGISSMIMSTVLAGFLDGPSFLRRFAISQAGLLVSEKRDEKLIETLLDTVVPVFHPTGTCRMGRSDDPGAVLDPLCRVRGIDGLRVADASVMPSIPTANTCLPTMMVAEHLAMRWEEQS
jgi:5-(hydroxymethyl)furfural/furfural oxidase